MRAKAQSSIFKVERLGAGDGPREGGNGRSQSQSGGEMGCKIAESIEFMKRHLDRPLQVATLAAVVNVSPSHFFVLFKRHTGSAPMDYFVRLRMEKACGLLNATELSVKEAATALGYEDPFHFSRAFKSVVGVSPSDYRKSQREGRNRIASGLGGFVVKPDGWSGSGLSPERVCRRDRLLIGG